MQQQGRDRHPGEQAEQARGQADREVLAHQQGDHAARGEPDGLQQPDLPPLGEHAPADDRRDGEADGDQRQQRVDADDDRVGLRLVGDRVADLVPVDDVQPLAGEGALEPGLEVVRCLRVREPHGEDAVDARQGGEGVLWRPGEAGAPLRVGGLLGGHGEAGDGQVLPAERERAAGAQAARAGEAALDEHLIGAAGEAPVGDVRAVEPGAQALEPHGGRAAAQARGGVDPGALLGRGHAGYPRDRVQLGGREVTGDRQVAAAGGRLGVAERVVDAGAQRERDEQGRGRGEHGQRR